MEFRSRSNVTTTTTAQFIFRLPKHQSGRNQSFASSFPVFCWCHATQRRRRRRVLFSIERKRGPSFSADKHTGQLTRQEEEKHVVVEAPWPCQEIIWTRTDHSLLLLLLLPSPLLDVIQSFFSVEEEDATVIHWTNIGGSKSPPSLQQLLFCKKKKFREETGITSTTSHDVPTVLLEKYLFKLKWQS